MSWWFFVSITLNCQKYQNIENLDRKVTDLSASYWTKTVAGQENYSSRQSSTSHKLCARSMPADPSSQRIGVDINAWISMHGCLSTFISMHGYPCIGIHAWIFTHVSVHGYPCMDVDTWISIHGYLSHLAVILPGEGAKHSLTVKLIILMYNYHFQ